MFVNNVCRMVGLRTVKKLDEIPVDAADYIYYLGIGFFMKNPTPK